MTLAQTSEPVEEDEQAAQVEADRSSLPADEGGAVPSPEVFLPTEEISEDFAAPFPVDI